MYFRDQGWMQYKVDRDETCHYQGFLDGKKYFFARVKFPWRWCFNCPNVCDKVCCIHAWFSVVYISTAYSNICDPFGIVFRFNSARDAKYFPIAQRRVNALIGNNTRRYAEKCSVCMPEKVDHEWFF